MTLSVRQSDGRSVGRRRICHNFKSVHLLMYPTYVSAFLSIYPSTTFLKSIIYLYLEGPVKLKDNLL